MQEQKSFRIRVEIQAFHFLSKKKKLSYSIQRLTDLRLAEG